MKYCSILLTMCLMPLMHFGQATMETDSVQIPGTSVGFNMNLIPGGTYMMGSPETDSAAASDQMPQFEVAVDSFWIGTYEISYEAYNIFRDKSPGPCLLTIPWNGMPTPLHRPSPPYEDPTFGMGRDGFPAVSMTQFAALTVL